MSDRKTLQIQRISGHAGPVPGKGVQRQETVCKLVDTTTCIGCKACEVACVEWNDMPFQPTMFDNTYQTMPDTHWNYWNLIKFDEVSNSDGTFQWLMRKHQCMHCADPGCLAACPADGAIVQYENGIVDFQQENCIGCQFCVRLPVQHSEVQSGDEEGLQVHALFRPRRPGLEPACIKACPTGCLHFGTKTDMLELAGTRVKQLQDHAGFKDAGVYDPQSIGGTSVVYVLHDIKNPEKYGNLPSNPVIPASFTLWKNWFKPIGLVAAVSAFAGVILHYVTEGPRRTQPQPPIKEIDGGEGVGPTSLSDNSRKN